MKLKSASLYVSYVSSNHMFCKSDHIICLIKRFIIVFYVQTMLLEHKAFAAGVNPPIPPSINDTNFLPSDERMFIYVLLFGIFSSIVYLIGYYINSKLSNDKNLDDYNRTFIFGLIAVSALVILVRGGFRQEIFTGIMGLFGTIVGYFAGSTKK